MDKLNPSIRITSLVVVGAVFLVIIFIAGIAIGSVQIPVRDVISILFTRESDEIRTYAKDEFDDIEKEHAITIVITHETLGTVTQDARLLDHLDLDDEQILSILVHYQTVDPTFRRIVERIRMPRVVAAMLGGAALAVAGLLLQIFFRNPIVDPFVLGISSGSTFVTALFMLAGLQFGMFTQTVLGRFFAAFVGALAVMVVMLTFALRVKNATSLLIIGIMVGYFSSAGTGFLMTFADKEAVKGFVIYSMGSFSGFMWKEIHVLAVIALSFLVGAFFIGKPLNMFLLGEDYAKSMGIHLKLFRAFIILISSVLTAVVTAFAGPVAFIGLAVPHIVRLLSRSSDARVLIPGCFLYGAVLTAFCDILARMIFSPQELALSTVTSFFGVPIVIHLIVKDKAKQA